MWFAKGRSRSRGAQLVRAAGLGRRIPSSASEFDICRDVAFQVSQSSSRELEAVLAVVEALLSTESDYAFACCLLEDLQNVTSHGLPQRRTDEEIRGLLGPRGLICWATLDTYWAKVSAWCEQHRAPLKSGSELLAIQNSRLQGLLWTSLRTLPTGNYIGIADVISYQKNVGDLMPNYSHITKALD
ncbi:MAG TPA: hypothetical protein VFP72_22210 [Kineosporiaceae bacterium]|nr:hypothetical protein [Kineosporiaceae bacterium]